jgi:REP element-mobilizing transposase RayT
VSHEIRDTLRRSDAPTRPALRRARRASLPFQPRPRSDARAELLCPFNLAHAPTRATSPTRAPSFSALSTSPTLRHAQLRRRAKLLYQSIRHQTTGQSAARRYAHRRFATRAGPGLTVGNVMRRRESNRQKAQRTRGEHGGRRMGAGRKPSRPGKRLRHVARPSHYARLPVHVTMRSLLRGLRTQLALQAFTRAIRAANARRATFRIVHFSLQSNHIHLLVEASDKRTLSSGMQGLAVRLARGFNRVLGRRGRFWADRYYARDLRSTSAVRNALVYVLANHRKHERSLRPGVDAFSSGVWFRGWLEPGPLPLSTAISRRTFAPDTPPVVAPRTWLLTDGWKVPRGRISISETPHLQDVNMAITR